VAPASVSGCFSLSVVLLEPNPFYLLAQEVRLEAFQEAKTLSDYVKGYGARREGEGRGTIRRLLGG
jgi:hypothetical protein